MPQDSFMQTLMNIEHIGSPPKLTLKILRKAEQEGGGLNEVAKLILSEPTITAQVLKVANSARYSPVGRITSVPQAVVHLGLETVKKILFAIEIMGIFPNNFVEDGFDEKKFWRNTMAGALIMQTLSFKKHAEQAESFFLTGLLRNTGVLIIRNYFPARFEEILALCNKEQVSFARACKAVEVLDQKQTAALVCDRWNLPYEVVAPLNCYATDNPIVNDIRYALDFSEAALHQAGYEIWDKHFVPATGITAEESNSLIDKVSPMMASLCEYLAM